MQSASFDDTHTISNINDIMTKTTITFEIEKQNKNSVRYKEIPKDGMPPILRSIYVQKWFAGNSKTIEVTIERKD
jgi:hypothetical protein